MKLAILWQRLGQRLANRGTYRAEMRAQRTAALQQTRALRRQSVGNWAEEAIFPNERRHPCDNN